MKVAIFDAHRFEKPFFEEANLKEKHKITYFDVKLSEETAPLVFGYDVICPFVNDRLDETVLKIIKVAGVKLIALRSLGFNHVDLEAALRLGLKVVRVPEYSPYAVAEHATALILALNRNLCRSHARVTDGNFSIDGLVGFDLAGKTVGIIGTGKIGSVMAKIMNGFSCEVVAYDVQPNYELKDVNYEPNLHQLYKDSDIISLHVPLNPDTHHVLDRAAFETMRPGVMIINTSRGALIDTHALVDALKSGKVGYAGLDVYEEEGDCFFQDLSNNIIQDDMLARLITFPNVMVTSHQGFLTREALKNIAEITLKNISDLEQGNKLVNQVSAEDVIRRVS